MVKHLVMFYFTDKVNDNNMEEVKKIISQSVKTMAESDINGLIKMEPAFNIVKGMPEVGLYCEFESVENLNAYQTHPQHERHKALTKDYCRDRVAFDWE